MNKEASGIKTNQHNDMTRLCEIPMNHDRLTSREPMLHVRDRGVIAKLIMTTIGFDDHSQVMRAMAV